MGCCSISNCGDNAVITACCDGGGDGSLDSGQSANGLINNVVAECQPDGSMLVSWETTPAGLTVVATLDESPQTVVGNTVTLPDWTSTGILVLTVDGTDETASVSLTACELPVAPTYTITAQCAGSQVALLINNPLNEMLYVYRTETDTLIWNSSTDLDYNDVAPEPTTNTYVVSRTQLPTLDVVATTSIDFSTCSVDCSSWDATTSQGYSVLNNTQDKLDYINNALTIDVEFIRPITGYDEPTSVRTSIPPIRVYKQGESAQLPYTYFTFNSWSYSAVERKVYANITVGNTNASTSSVWPHNIYLDLELCYD